MSLLVYYISLEDLLHCFDPDIDSTARRPLSVEASLVSRLGAFDSLASLRARTKLNSDRDVPKTAGEHRVSNRASRASTPTTRRLFSRGAAPLTT